MFLICFQVVKTRTKTGLLTNLAKYEYLLYKKCHLCACLQNVSQNRMKTLGTETDSNKLIEIII
jgi:hypothetical protein